MEKIYITGSVGSGKSTLAKKMSETYRIPYYELDKVVHKRIGGNKRLGNEKRSETERDKIFSDIISSDKWIIEDGLRECFKKGLEYADTIILLDIPFSLIRFRIIMRWIKQNLRLEKCEYKPSFYILKFMFKWSRWFNENKTLFLQNFSPYESKLIVLDRKRIKSYLKSE